MKKLYKFFFLLVSLLITNFLFANQVTVKGHLFYPNGLPVKNYEVKIAGYLTAVTTSCSEVTVVTNNEGVYSQTITCQGDIINVRIATKNCDGHYLVKEKPVPSTKIVEANFEICAPPCIAKFEQVPVTVSPGQGYPVRSNSSASEASPGDEIIERIWRFGDGSNTLNGNIVDPTHVYTAPGIYEVCLTINTKLGCRSYKCMPIEIKASCKAVFTFEPTLNGIKFNSSNSSAPANDQIVLRRWNFGDGSAEVTGSVDPTHVFPHPGLYNVCLAIKTAAGCESRECRQVIALPSTPSNCAAVFIFERITPKKFRFNSTQSIAGPNNHIQKRHWNFGDGSAPSNEISPLYEFSNAGTYNVCLVIKTIGGCEKKLCILVKVEEGVITPDHTPIKIVSLYPTPVHTELKALVFSKNNNVPATIFIVNVYGEVKYSKTVVLLQGNNQIAIPVVNLLSGPYFFRISSAFGTQSRPFYKL